MSQPTKEDLLDKLEAAKRNLLDLSSKLLEEIDNLETIHLEYSTKDGTDEN